MNQEHIHNQICRNIEKLNQWYESSTGDLTFPIYSSFDIRDSGQKICPVDANIYPAGFNNICDIDKENAAGLFKQYLNKRYPKLGSYIVILAEEHTKNAYYWENVYTLKSLIEKSNYKVQIAIPKELNEPLSVKSINGHELQVFGAKRVANEILVDDKKPDLIINNNDFSSDYSEWVEGLEAHMNPHYKLGWYWRRKESFFKQYNELVEEFSGIIDVPKEVLQVKTMAYKNFDINDEDSRNDLAQEVDKFIEEIKLKYEELNISDTPFVFIKNSSGTYGLGVTKVESGEEVRSWSNKSRKKMKAAKGGGGFDEVIIQEGIPTRFSDENETAEPAIYLVGKCLAGGFLRTHSKKGPDDNLNSPGAVYKRLCVSDLNIDSTKCPLENVYGWLAKLGVLAIAIEAKEAGIKF